MNILDNKYVVLKSFFSPTVSARNMRQKWHEWNLPRDYQLTLHFTWKVFFLKKSITGDSEINLDFISVMWMAIRFYQEKDDQRKFDYY